MSKTIKVIDLLNKIANGEEVPKKIKYGYKEYEYKSNSNLYVREDGTFGGDWALDMMLDEEVEIIEEEPEIDIQAIEELGNFEIIEQTKTTDIANILLKYGVRINELIKAVRQLDKQIKEK